MYSVVFEQPTQHAQDQPTDKSNIVEQKGADDGNELQQYKKNGCCKKNI